MGFLRGDRHVPPTKQRLEISRDGAVLIGLPLPSEKQGLVTRAWCGLKVLRNKDNTHQKFIWSGCPGLSS